MGSPKRVLVPPPAHVKISPTGRPYVDTSDLIKRQMERIERARQDRSNGCQPSPPDNQNNNNNSHSQNGGG